MRIRKLVESVIKEKTQDWTCDYKHDVTENVLFNIWLNEIKALASMDYERAKNEVESYINIIKRDMKKWKDLKHDHD